MFGLIAVVAVVLGGAAAGVAGGIAWARARSRDDETSGDHEDSGIASGPSAADQEASTGISPGPSENQKDQRGDHEASGISSGPSAADQEASLGISPGPSENQKDQRGDHEASQGDPPSSQRGSRWREASGPDGPSDRPSAPGSIPPREGDESDPPTSEPNDPATTDTDPQPWVVSGGVDGGGTHAVLDCPPHGFTPAAVELLTLRPRGDRWIEGVEAHVGRADGGVLIRVPGRAVLHLHYDHARLVMPSAAVEREGVEAWLDRWPSWASCLLLGRPLERHQLHAAGWRTGNLDVHCDTASIDPPDAWIVLEDAWTGRSARGRPHPDGYDSNGRLTGFWLGRKANGPRGKRSASALHAYNKSLEQRESATPSPALQARHAAAGYRPELHGDVWRWEGSLSGDALRLRSAEGDGDQWNLEDPASWACSAAINAAWAYLVGVPGVRTSGVIRLTDEAERDRPAKKRRAHPIWEVLRSASSSATRERLTQARACAELELGIRQERAEARVGRALGQLAGVVGAAETPATAAEFATAVVPRITQRDDWADHVTHGRVDHADLHELASGEPHGDDRA